jgi:hypothetical protein
MVSSIQQMKTQVVTRVVTEKNKVLAATYAIIGSRVLLAALTLLMVAFAAQVLFDPAHLPPIAGLDSVKAFLPNVDAGVIGQKANEAQAAFVRQGGLDKINDFIRAHQTEIPLYNQIGLGLSFLLLTGNILFAAQKWKGASSITIGAP